MPRVQTRATSMAKSDSDSNGLRQDQPECPLQSRGVRRVTHVMCVAIETLGTLRRSGVTELPGLTSDPIYTADRRGGILISFGSYSRPERVLNPSSQPDVDPARPAAPTGPRLHPKGRGRENLSPSKLSPLRHAVSQCLLPMEKLLRGRRPAVHPARVRSVEPDESRAVRRKTG